MLVICCFTRVINGKIIEDEAIYNFSVDFWRFLVEDFFLPVIKPPGTYFNNKNKSGKTVQGIRLEYMHRGQTYLTASHSQLRYFVIFLISRRDGENNGFLAGVPLHPPFSRVVSRPNSLLFPFRTPATQAM